MRSAALLLLLALPLGGCVYSSPVPLADPATAPFDEALLGHWVPEDELQSDLPSGLDVSRLGEHAYLVEWVERAPFAPDSAAPARERVRAFITVVGETRFLNLQAMDEGDAGFNFARFTLAADTLRLQLVAEMGQNETRGLKGQFATSELLLAAVRARANDPLLCEEEDVVLRRTR